MRDLSAMTDAELRAYMEGAEDASTEAVRAMRTQGVPASSSYACGRDGMAPYWRAEKEMRRRRGE